MQDEICQRRRRVTEAWVPFMDHIFKSTCFPGLPSLFARLSSQVLSIWDQSGLGEPTSTFSLSFFLMWPHGSYIILDFRATGALIHIFLDMLTHYIQWLILYVRQYSKILTDKLSLANQLVKKMLFALYMFCLLFKVLLSNVIFSNNCIK